MMKSFSEIMSYTDRRMKYLGNRWLEAVFPNEEAISQVIDMLSDDYSKDLYCREIAFCILRNFLKDDLAPALTGFMTHAKFGAFVEKARNLHIHDDLEHPESSDWPTIYCKTTTFVLEQYRYKNKVEIEAGDVCLDIGAGLGDTSIWMLENGAKSAYAFEIDKVNLECMQRTKNKSSVYENIHIVNKACANATGKLYYIQGDMNIAGRVLDAKPATGNYYEIDAIRVDDFCKHNAITPNFIKMDIEGAELQAIEGASEIFEKTKPKFAIAIYHSWEHRWQVPLLLRELCPDYEFYMKKSDVFCETVLFGRAKTGL